MADLGMEFNDQNVPEDTRDYELVPAGWYPAEFERPDLVPTKDGRGKRITGMWRIYGDSHNNRVIFEGINIHNPSPEAERIGRAQLQELRLAANLGPVRDTNQLSGARCMIKVAIQPAKDGYEAKNVVKGYKALNGSAAPQPSAATKAAAGGAPPPWAKR